MTDQSFIDYLLKECHYPVALETGDGRYVAIYPFMYTHAIIVGQMEDRAGYDDRWCYHYFLDAATALAFWKANDFVGEPVGWHRHPKSGRRRENGVEWIEP